MKALSQQASFWVSAGVIAHAFWTSASPAMTYPLYAAQWHLTHLTSTAIFAVYPVVVVFTLIAFGGVSDIVGRRTAMLLGLAASLSGILLFACANAVAWLFVGRALMGIGVGLSTGPATAALIEFSIGAQTGRASSVTTSAQSLGFVCAFVVTGALIEYAPYPTHLSFWVLFAVLSVLFATSWLLPRPAVGTIRGRWQLRVPAVPEAVRGRFLLSAVALTAAYTQGVLVLSLGAKVAHDLVGSHNALVNGVALALSPLATGIVGSIGRRLRPRLALIQGGTISIIAMMLFVGSVLEHNVGIFLTATSAAGAGYALLVFGGLEHINSVTPVNRRGGVYSGLYLCGYLSLGVVALLLGAIATAYNLTLAVTIGSGTLIIMNAIAVFLAARFRETPLQV
jgi:hypothetical protein